MTSSPIVQDTRRGLLFGSAALALAYPAWAATDHGHVLGLQEAARIAWLYGLPLIEVGNQAARARVMNQFVHARILAGPSERAVTAPNNDTLYSTAWLDLSAGPVTLRLPKTGDRYFGLQFIDAYTNNIAVLGSRTTGGQGGSVTVVGPTSPGPAGALRATTPRVWVLGRILVDGPDDLAAVHALQDALLVEGPSRAPPKLKVTRRDAAWPDYFAAVQQLLLDNPPPITDRAFFASITALGLSPSGGFDPARFSADQGAAIAAGVAQARAALPTINRTRVIRGWAYPDDHGSAFGQDYGFRAAVALTGIGALPSDEALYLKPLDPEGRQVFEGDDRWRIHLPNGGLPVDGFWSLTMYEVTPARQRFLTPNPLNRYAIGSRTPGLMLGPDGALDILVSRTDPGGGARANWLPAPATGPFLMSMRAYLPRPELVSAAYPFTPIERVAAS